MRNRNLTIFFILSLTVLSLLCPAPTRAEGETITVGCPEGSSFLYREENGEYAGYGAAYLEKIAAYTGWSYRFVTDSWENCLAMLRSGQIDLIGGMRYSEVRDLFFDFSAMPIGDETNVIYTFADNGAIYYEDFPAMAGCRAGLLTTGDQTEAFYAYAAANGFSCETRFFDDEEKLTAALDAGDVDLIVTGSLSTHSGYKTVARFGAQAVYFACRQDAQTLLSRLNDAIDRIHSLFPTFEAELYETYYGDAAFEGALFSRDEVQYIESAGVLSVGMPKNEAPLSHMTTDADLPDGILVALLRRIETVSGLEFTFVSVPEDVRAAGNDYYEQNGIDLIGAALPTQQGPSPVTLTELYFTSEWVEIREKTAQNAADIAVIAIPAGETGLEDAVKKTYPGAQIKQYANVSDCMQVVCAGDAQAAYCDRYLAEQQLLRPRFSCLTAAPGQSVSYRICIGLVQPDDTLLSVLNKSIDQLSAGDRAEAVISNTTSADRSLSILELAQKYSTPLLIALGAFVALLLLPTILAAVNRKRYQTLNAQTRELTERAARAETDNRAKSAYLSRVSREMRTPLNAILNAAISTKRQIKGNDKLELTMDKLTGASRSLLCTVNDVLDLSSIENGSLELHDEEFSIHALIDEIVSIYSAQCRKKQAKMSCSYFDITADRVMGDPQHCTQILNNLLSHAVRAVSAQGRVSLAVMENNRDEGMSLRFIVTDNGSGMDDMEKALLFHPFAAQQVRTSANASLGLAIARELTELMHGAFELDSEIGRGTTFTVEIPINPIGIGVEGTKTGDADEQD